VEIYLAKRVILPASPYSEAFLRDVLDSEDLTGILVAIDIEDASAF
jgi:hypothetical protein